MAHTKIIQSGTQVEIYQYERDAPQKVTRKKSRRANSRRRTRSVQRSRLTFFRLVRANVSAEARPALVTLTMREVCTLGQAWKCFTAFALRVRKKRKSNFAFIAVPEFQKRGAVHFHVLVWGLSDVEIARERDSRAVAQQWGHGYVDIRPTDGSEKLAGYLAKYMFKAMWDERLLGNKAFSGSRNLVRPVSLNSPVQVDEAQKQWGIGVDNPVLTEKEYPTKWMGKCVYKVYSIAPV